MRWLLLWLCVSTAAALELLCEAPGCTAIPQDDEPLFEINGKEVEIRQEDGLFIGCRRSNSNVLESSAMPRFASELRVSKVILENCPLPANISIAQALANLNVTLHPKDGKAELQLKGIPSTPQVTAQHFSGLQVLTNLLIKSEILKRPNDVSAGFLSGLKNLRDLSLINLEMRPGELQRLPQTITNLYLVGYSMNDITGTICEAVLDISLMIPNLKSLKLDTSRMNEEPITVNETKVYNQAIDPLIEKLTLVHWLERSYPPLEKCNRLRQFEITDANVVELPDRFVAVCPLLEELIIDYARNIKELPAGLLEGAKALKIFSLTKSKLQTLPERIFQGLPNLSKVDLSDNQINNLPNAVFVGVPLQSLSLNYNYLSYKTLSALAPLSSLTELRLQSNTFLMTCYDTEFSPLQNLTLLKILDLSFNNQIRQICPDWRENLVHLEYLDLYETGIQELKYADLQYTRDSSTKNAVVLLKPTIAITFSKDDYKSSLTATTTGATIRFEERKISPFDFHPTFYINNYYNVPLPNCGCAEYWLRGAMNQPNHPVKVEGYTCSNGKSLEDITDEELCPENDRT